MHHSRTFLVIVVMLVASFSMTDGSAKAQEADKSDGKVKLENDALAISGRYTRFERMLSQMADLLAVEDPERAELLRRAIGQSREKAIGTNIEAIANLLADDSLGDAIDKQQSSAQAMAVILKLLQSEDRRSAVEKERERLNDILKNVRNTIAEQRAARAAAQNSNAPSNAAPQQQKAMKSTDEILDGIEKHDGQESSESESGDSQSDSSDSKDGKSADGKSGEPRNADNADGDSPQDKSDTSGKSGEGKTGDESPQDPDADKENKSGDDSKTPTDDADDKSGNENGKPSDGQKGGEPQKSQDGKSSDESQSQQSDSDSKSQSQSGGSSGQNSQQQQDEQQEQTPGREQLEQARNLMQQALDQLKDQEREEAVEKQDDAISELEKAAKELEELLKQLREEEKEMILAALEARFQRLLAIQTQIYETTVDLADTPRSEWLDAAVSECRELAQQQAQLTQECGQTSALLREDGTSVAILVAVEDIEVDMGTIAERLQETKAGSLTQTMETDVIEALKELIEATQKEMQEMKSEQRQQQQQQSQQQKPPLVELMAEIKMLRSLQLRVNGRTRKIDLLLQESDADTAALNEQLAELARRQDRLRESAIELSRKMKR